MQFPSILLGASILVAGAAAAAVATCNTDNCLRAVRATSPPTRSLVAGPDCTSFMAVTSTTTVTSASSTSTVTVFAGFNNPSKRDVHLERRATPTIPAYASSFCRNSAAHVSACNCAGYSSPATSVSTTTVNVVATTTRTCSGFKLQATAGPSQGAYFSYEDINGGRVLFFDTNPDNAIVYEFKNSRVQQVGHNNVLDTSERGEGVVYTDDLDAYNAGGGQGYIAPTCVIGDAGAFSCTREEPGYFYPGNDRGLLFTPNAATNGVFVPKAIPAC